jgi:predicted dehydrogenase
MTPPVRAALVGYGLAGRAFHAPLIRHTPGMELHIVVSRDAARVQADLAGVHVAASIDPVLSDPTIDLVVIATPNDTHAPLAEAALAAGKHVLVDKPFALDATQARAVLAAAARAGRIATAFHNRRRDADFLVLRDLIDTGVLGTVSEMHSHFDRFRPQVPDRWRDRAGPGAGLWLDLGPHLADQALQLFGLPDAVQADIAAQRAGARSDDWFHVVLRYPAHRVILHAGSLVADAGLRFAAHGSRGSYVKHGLDPQEQALREGRTPGSRDWGRDPQPGWLTTVREGIPTRRLVDDRRGDYPGFYAALRDAIRGGTPAPVGVEEILDLMRVLDAGVASAARACAVVP